MRTCERARARARCAFASDLLPRRGAQISAAGAETVLYNRSMETSADEMTEDAFTLDAGEPSLDHGDRLVFRVDAAGCDEPVPFMLRVVRNPAMR